MVNPQIVILAFTVVAGAVGGFCYGVYTGLLWHVAALAVVVLSVAGLFLFSHPGAALFASVVTIAAAVFGVAWTIRIRSAIPEGLMVLVAVITVLLDIAGWGAWAVL